MFKIVTKPTFKKKVHIELPTGAGGVDKTFFMGVFQMLDTDETVAAGDLSAKDLALKVLVGFEGVGDEDGNPVAFSEDTRDALISNPMVLNAICRTYWKAVSGNPAGKN